MIAAGRLRRVPARTPWPMHAALWELHDSSGRLGLRRELGVGLDFSPSPDVGRQAAGADAAFLALVRAGLLRKVGEGRSASLEVDDNVAVAWRRRIMSLDPAAVGLFQRAGERWAALASTCANTAESVRESPTSMVASGAA